MSHSYCIGYTRFPNQLGFFPWIYCTSEEAKPPGTNRNGFFYLVSFLSAIICRSHVIAPALSLTMLSIESGNRRPVLIFYCAACLELDKMNMENIRERMT